jgi:hypothetical protein
MAVDLRLVEKGRREPRSGLVEEGRAHVELARRYAAPLAANGWWPADTDALDQALAELSPTPGPPVSDGEARDAQAAEWSAIEEAREFLRRLCLVAPILARRRPELLEAIPLDQAPGQSAASLSAYLEKIRPGVALLDAGSSRYFKGTTASEDLDRVKRELDTSRAREEAQLGTLPEDDAGISESKGRVLEMIEDLDRVAEIAFEGQAAVLGQFNLDILWQARRARRG